MNLPLLSRMENKLNKPYFLFRPTQVVRRLALPLHQRRLTGEFDHIRLPWGLPLRFRARDKSGLCYARRGVFDLPVCEALWRLSDPGELALDVGANIGQMTSALSAAVGPTGRVISFEPHPEIFALLHDNVARWNGAGDTGAIELRHLGLASSCGTAQLGMSEAFESNAGTASMCADDERIVRTVDVPIRRLDDELGEACVGVMKLDVEGYELEVLRGAPKALAEHRIRDIVFEEFGEAPTPVSELLQSSGYEVYSLDQTLLGPMMEPARADWRRRSTEDPSYLATADPERARDRMQRRGWAVLGRGPYGGR